MAEIEGALDGVAERARQGDRVAFSELYQELWPRIYRHVYRMMGADGERGRDLAQEAFTRAFAAIGQTPPGLRFRPWIYRIATNLCLNELEKKRPTLELTELHDLDREGPDARGLQREERRRVWRTLRGLPPKARQVLVLRELDELGFDEIALVLGTTTGNVQVMLHRARRRFASAHATSIPGEAETASLACHEFDEMVRQYVEGELEPVDRARLQQHLDACAGCEAERKSHRAASAMFAMLPVVRVPEAPAGLVAGSTGAGAGGSIAVGAPTVLGAKLAIAGSVIAVATLAIMVGARGWWGPVDAPRSVASRPVHPVGASAAPSEPAPGAAAPPALPAPPAVVAETPANRRVRPALATERARATGPVPSAGPLATGRTRPAPAPAGTRFGQVLFGRAGRGRAGALRVGSAVRSGDVLRSVGFLSVALGERNQVRLEPGSQVRTAIAAGRPTVRLGAGELWVRRSTQDLHVVAPRTEVDPQGGSVRVRTLGGQTIVEALSEVVLARFDGTMVILQRGQGASTRAPHPEPLPSAPSGLRPTGFDGTGTPLLAWDPVPGVRGYRLEIARSPEFLEMETAISTDTTEAQPGLPIGRHYWRVVSESASSTRSLTSRIYSFFIE